MAKKDNLEYWQKRALKHEARSAAKGDALAKKLKREYEKAAKAIREKIDAFYGRYASENGLSYAEAVKRLNSKEAREWKKTLGEYVEEINAIEDKKIKARLIAELDARSYASQQDRLSSLQAQIDMEVDRLFSTGEHQMTMTMTDVFTDGYYHKAFDLQQRAGVISEFARLSPSLVEDVLTYPWSGADFSTRLWENKRALLFSLRQEMTQGIVRGLSVAAMSKGLADTLGKSYTVAERLMRTEANHFHNEADKAAYKAAGVEEYEFMATLDNRTSAICGSLDGKHFPLSEAKPGVNYPPMHPHCRSTTIEYDPEDAADWAASGQPMPKNMTYEEWKAEQDATDLPETEAKNEPSSKPIDRPIEKLGGSATMKAQTARSFYDGQELNNFFYFDDYEKSHGLLAKKNSQYGKWRANLSKDSQDAVYSYTADGYGDVNDYLRKKNGWETISPIVAEQIEKIDDAISTFNLKAPIVVQRGAAQSSLDVLFENYDIEELSDLVGKKYWDDAFMSSTALYGNPVATAKPVVFDISIPAGTGRGAYINEFGSQYKDSEYEFLIKRGARFTITDISEDVNLEKIYVKMVMDDE